MKHAPAYLTCALVLCCATPVHAQTILRVDCTASDPSPDGSTWPKAYGHLQDALAAVTGPGTTQIWVAECTYMPDGAYTPVAGAHTLGSGDRTATFQLINDVEIYGGFPTGGGDGTFDARDPHPETNGTVLGGDLDGDDVPVPDPADLRSEATRAENSYHVLAGSGTNAAAVLDGFTITDGNANGSGPNSFGGGMYNFIGGPTLMNCTFRSNYSESRGGLYSLGSDSMITGCTFTGNAANTSGGGLYISGGNSTITGCTFSGNYSDAGGGLHISSGYPTITGCTFSGNYTSDAGGGLHISAGNPVVTGCTITGNASRIGGAVSIIETSSPVVTGCTISGNTATSDGGGIFLGSSGSPVVTGCTISGNTSNAPLDSDQGGGGIYCGYNSTPTITSCTISNNAANSVGGGVFCRAASIVHISGSAITGSTSVDGGGVYGQFGSELTINSSTIEGNHASSVGGGVYITGVSLVQGSVIANNTAELDGAGLYLAGGGISAPIIIRDNVIAGNIAGLFASLAYGGGVYIGDQVEQVLIRSNTIIENAATFGGGIYTLNPAVAIRNNVIAFTLEGEGVLSEASAATTVASYNCLWDNIDGDLEGNLVARNNIYADPLLASLGSFEFGGVPGDFSDFTYVVGDYHLTESSPCIDTGDPLFASFPDETDIDGETRVAQGRVDIGADEFGSIPPPSLEGICGGLGVMGDPTAFISPKSKSVGVTIVDIMVTEDVSLVSPSSWCVTSTGGSPPAVVGLTPDSGGLHFVEFDGAVEVGEWTTVTLTVENGSGVDGQLCFQIAQLPGDIDRNGQVNLNDATKFGSEFDGPQTLKLADLNDDGQVNLNDATKFGQIWRGTSDEGKNPDGTGGWNGAGLPARPACGCP